MLTAAAMAAVLLATAVAVHDAEGNGGDQCYHEGNSKEVYYHGHLSVMVVCSEHNRFVLTGVVAGKDGTLVAVQRIEILAGY